MVVCEIKPMEIANVTDYNLGLNEYLLEEKRRGRGGYGCKTQIRLEFLKADGYHIRPQFDGVVDRTYACAIMGVNVPCPTPVGEFVPMSVRRKWEAEWPKVARGGGAQAGHHGWRR